MNMPKSETCTPKFYRQRRWNFGFVSVKALNRYELLFGGGHKMIIVSYDISDDKLRAKFAKYLSRFGHRIQYSVFEIDNSPRIVNNIVNDLKNKYESKFGQTDSVIIFKMSSSCEVMRFGYAKNDEKDFLIIT